MGLQASSNRLLAGGDTNFTGSSDTAQHAVNEANITTTVIDDTPDPSVVG